MASKACCPPARPISPSRKGHPLPACRYAVIAGQGRIASATSSSASPISEVTLLARDCDKLFAAFTKPVLHFSLIRERQHSPCRHNNPKLFGSNKTFFNCCMSSIIKSNRSVPTLVCICCFNLSLLLHHSAISSATTAGS